MATPKRPQTPASVPGNSHAPGLQDAILGQATQPPNGISGVQASGVVLNWRRPRNTPRVVGAMLACGRIDEVIIWDNAGDETELKILTPSRVRIIRSLSNLRTWGRYLATVYARHDLIVTCDDDNLVQNWDAIIDAFADDPTRIIAAMPPGHARLHSRLVWGDRQEVLLGWGAAFDRRWIGPAFAPWIERYGVDELLVSKADRVFSIGLGRRHRIIPADFELLDGAMSDEAVYREQGHTARVREARRRALELPGVSTKGE